MFILNVQSLSVKAYKEKVFGRAELTSQYAIMSVFCFWVIGHVHFYVYFECAKFVC